MEAQELENAEATRTKKKIEGANVVELLADEVAWPLVGPVFDPPLDAGMPVVEVVEGPGGVLASDGVAGEAGPGAPWGDPAAGAVGMSPDGAAKYTTVNKHLLLKYK